MELTDKLLTELQKRLKVGNLRGIHLNAIPAKSRYKFDICRLSYIDKNLPNNFIQKLLTEQPLKFRISWKNNVEDLNSLFEEEQLQIVRITKSFENLINQTETIELEKGINTFGFGFPLLIRRNQEDNKLTVSPILIWSLRIKRTKEFNTWEINRNEDDPIYLNEVLINHLENDAKIELDPIPNEMLDDGLISESELIEICSKLLETINASVPRDISQILNTKLKNIHSIGDKAHYENLPINPTASLIDFCGLFSIFEVQKQNIISDYDSLLLLKNQSIDLDDLYKNSFQSITSVETDPSQQSILHSLELTRNILIQGPPGTGKSQTLTAILINAMENQKKTLVVCEKRTALEVLHNALNDNGLAYHCALIKDIVKDRRPVVDSVRDRIENSSYRKNRYPYSKEPLNSIISRAKNLIDSINNKHKKLNERLLGDKTWTYVVGKLLTEIKGADREINFNLKSNHYSYSSQELDSIIGILQKGESLYSEFKSAEPISFIEIDKFLTFDNPYVLEQNLNKSFELYKNKLAHIKTLEQEYNKDFLKIRDIEFQEQIKSYNEILREIKAILEINRKEKDFLNEERTKSFIYKSLSIFSNDKKRILEAQDKFWSHLKKLQVFLDKTKDLPKIKLHDLIVDNLTKLDEVQESTKRVQVNFKNVIEDEYSNINLLEFRVVQYQTESLKLLKEEVLGLVSLIYKDKWTSKNIRVCDLLSFYSDVESLFEIKRNYLANENDLLTYEFKWYRFFYSLTEGNKEIINELKAKVNWPKMFLIHYLNSMLIKTANNIPNDNNEHVELDKVLNGVGKEQLKFILEYWFSKQVDAAREFEQIKKISVENLFNKRSSSKYKRLTLRQIVRYDSNLFTTFFPIILTTPDVCCNLFKGMNGYFDIVMFDEASQLKLEDTLPCILKGKQKVISGDEHQMPPSNYFSRVFDGSIEEEDDIDEEDQITIDTNNLYLSCESLLEFGAELNFEKKYLDFHYRSRHPYLIDFSNHAFYNKRLKPLPNDFDYIPFKYIQVNGTFSEYTNEAEAEMVLSILENNINRLPDGNYPTVGVATFNIAQRNLIKSKILERQKFAKYGEFNAKIQELDENGMFIKNLENIQGDEKDVIILSTTYGVGKDGKFAQRFGPLNHSKGYKLLNVIITRAKYKVYVCSSIPEEVFLNYKEYLDLEGSNNKRAVFYAYLAYSKAVSEGNEDLKHSVLEALSENSSKITSFDVPGSGELESPFEEEVYQMLAKEFGEKKLIPQFQFAGFRIDIVYDAKISRVPKIAIECDGAKYHSSREAYLYDRHRQKILEDHGFVFHRIWSANWWRNSSREFQNLVNFIKSVEAQRNFKLRDFSKTALAFTDDIANIESYVDKRSDKDLVEEVSAIQTIEKEVLQPPKEVKIDIKLNSKVKIKYLNNGKDLRVQIVDTEHHSYEHSEGMQKIYYKSPLAVSLLSHSVGDIVKVGTLDNFVEIVEIEN